MKWITILLVVFCISSAAIAGGEEGRTVDFSLGTSLDWNDNVYLRENDEKGKFVITVTPRIAVKVPKGKSYFEFNTNLEYQNVGFGDYNLFNPSAKILFRQNLCEWSSFGIWDKYQKSFIPGDLGEDFDLNTVGVDFKRQFSSALTGKLGYTYQTLDYPDDDENIADYHDSKITGGVDFRLGRRSVIGVGGHYQAKNFNEPGGAENLKDYDSYGAKVRYETGVGAKSTFGLYGGYTKKDYEVTYNGESEDEFYTAGIFLNVPMTEKTSIRVYYDQGVQDTYYVYPGEVLDPEYDPVTDIIMDTFRDAEVSRIGLNARHQLSEKIGLNMGISFATNKAGIEKRLPPVPVGTPELDEDILEAGAGISYRLGRRVTVSLDYTYGKRDSEARSDYTYNAASVGFKLDF